MNGPDARSSWLTGAAPDRSSGPSVLEVLVVPARVVVPVLVALRDLLQSMRGFLGGRVGPQPVLAATSVHTFDRVVLQAEPELSVVTHPPTPSPLCGFVG